MLLGFAKEALVQGICWYPADDSEILTRRLTQLRDGGRWRSWSGAGWKVQRITFQENLHGGVYSLDKSEGQWNEIEKTGILKFDDVEVVQFDTALTYGEADAESMKLASDRRGAWKMRKGCWISLKQWAGQRVRFAFLVEWYGNIAYRIGYVYGVDKGRWAAAHSVTRSIRLG